MDEEHIEKLLERFVEVLLFKQSSSIDHHTLINVSHRIDEIDKKVVAILTATQKPFSTSASASQPKNNQAANSNPKPLSTDAKRVIPSKQHQFSIQKWFKDNHETVNAILAFFVISLFRNNTVDIINKQ